MAVDDQEQGYQPGVWLETVEPGGIIAMKLRHPWRPAIAELRLDVVQPTRVAGHSMYPAEVLVSRRTIDYDEPDEWVAVGNRYHIVGSFAFAYSQLEDEDPSIAIPYLVLSESRLWGVPRDKYYRGAIGGLIIDRLQYQAPSYEAA